MYSHPPVRLMLVEMIETVGTGIQTRAAAPEIRRMRTPHIRDQTGRRTVTGTGTAIGRAMRPVTGTRPRVFPIMLSIVVRANKTRITDVSILSSPSPIPVRRPLRPGLVAAAELSLAESAPSMAPRLCLLHLLRGRMDDLLETTRDGMTAPTVRRQQGLRRLERGEDMMALATASTPRPLRLLRRPSASIQTACDT